MMARVETETQPVWKRVVLGFVCLLVAPVVGLACAGSMSNPPGNGPGVGQVMAGVVVPVSITCIAALIARMRLVDACLWTTASLVMTGALLVLLVWFVTTSLPT
jgi:hypothetical protein